MNNATVFVPLVWWLPFLAGSLTLSFVILLVRRIERSKKASSSDEPFEGGMRSVGETDSDSFVRGWDPRIKLACGIIFSFICVSLSSLSALLIALIWAGFALAMAKIPTSVIMKRLQPVVGLTIILLLLLPVSAPIGENTRTIVLEPFTKMPFNYEALVKAIAIGIKAITVVLITTIILETSTYTVTISALQKIGVPSSLAQMLLLSYRYIFVLLDEGERMHRAMRLRGFTPQTNLQTLKVMGQFVGTLFVRSFERIQRITEAMKLRGYRGKFPNFYEFKARRTDWALGLLWILISAGIYLADSLF